MHCSGARQQWNRLDPDLVWRPADGRAEILRRSEGRNDFRPCEERPLSALRAVIAESRIEIPDPLPPMAAGIFGYLGYDMVRLMEELPSAPAGSHQLCGWRTYSITSSAKI